MNGFDFATILIILAEYGLGLSVLAANPRRRVNQCFCLLSLATGSWMLCLQIGFHDTSASQVCWLIRVCTVLGGFFPVGYNLLRLAILYPELSMRELLKRCQLWFLAYLLIDILAFSRWYLVSVSIPTPGSVFAIPEPVYGNGFFLWAAYFLSSLIIICVLFSRDIPRVRGRQRIDLQFVFIGLLCTIGLGIVFTIIMPLILGSSKMTRLAPFCTVGLQALVAYGIATRQMLDVSAFIRRGVAYVVLCAFLASLYATIWVATDLAMDPFDCHHPLLPNLLATLAIALAISPSRNIFQKVVTQIIGNWHGIDPNRVLPETDAMLRSVNTTPVVLRKFGRLCMRATGTDHVTLYLAREHLFEPIWSTHPGTEQPLAVDSALAALLASQHRPFYADSITHYHLSSQHATAYRDITTRKGSLAIGLYDHHALSGIVLLGEKLSGRIYDEDQQAILQIMVNRLAIALENASLYTRLQESKLYVETLVDQLLSGIIVIDHLQRITIFNREASRLLRINPAPLGKDITCLPECLREAVLATRETDRPLRDQAITLEGSGGRPLPVRFGCRTFGHDSLSSRSTFLILDDLTQMKKLEEQLRRSDRLTSLGTLAASVAHEIKNPLVAIKTFVQLLPERKTDITFIDNFTQLIGGEVSRIDNIVNQLLSFSRASTPHFQKVNLHAVLDNTLRLMRHDLTRNSILCQSEFNSPSDLIWGDRQKIEQVILNLVLNAQDAMPHGGHLAIRTSQQINPATDQIDLLLEIQDDGTGINPDVMKKAFDPFFTTKETGTGLGLSIVYGIITEHHGTIELRNGIERGTCVQIKLPLYNEKPAAA